MAQYQNTMNVAMSDGVIDNSEAKAILRQQLAQKVRANCTKHQRDYAPTESLEDIAKRLGIDRFSHRPNSVGRKLTISQPAINQVNLAPKVAEKRLDLSPPGTAEGRASELRGVNGLTCGELTKAGGECKRVTKDGEPCWQHATRVSPMRRLKHDKL